MGKRSRKRPLGSSPEDEKPRAKKRPSVQPPKDDSIRTRAKTSWRYAAEASAPGTARPPRSRKPSALRERPPALWGKAPVSELLILAGVICIGVGIASGPENGRVFIFVGLALAGIASVEFAGREHLYGIRSHSILLALIPTVLFHAAVYAIGSPDAARNSIVVGIDVVLFGVLFVALSRAFKHARADLK